MRLQNNPFYILNLTCAAGRREIMSAAEELSFSLDPEVCLSAQNELINPGKRLSAELGWFIELNKKQLKDIHEKIENGEEIQTDSLNSLSRLNATTYNFSLLSETDIFELGYAILDIDTQYAKLDANEICKTLNQSRTSAKIAVLSEKEISAGINNKRYDIRQIISEKLFALEQEPYIELITMLAEKCMADKDYEDGVILEDVIDQYEVRMQSQIEEITAQIKTYIAHIKELANDDAITDNVDTLIRQVQKWDIMVQPLQLKSQASGMPHEISERLGVSLRDLALYLNNKKGRTNDALTLMNAMKDVFAELGVLSDVFDSDSKALKGILNNKDLSADIDAVLKLAESLKSFATSATVSAFVDRVKLLNGKLKSSILDSESRIKAREGLCCIAREVALELYYTKHQTDYALTISKALLFEFGDIPSLELKLQKDVTTLNLHHSLSKRPFSSDDTSSSGSSKKLRNSGWLVAILAVVIVLCIAAASNVSSNDPETTQSGNSSANITTDNDPKSFSSPKPDAPKPTASSRSELEKLRKEIEEMESKLDSLGSDINDYESQLEDLSNYLDDYEAQYHATGNVFYYNSYYETADEYNEVYEEYSDMIDEYNSLYSEYSSAIDSYNRRIGY